MFATSVAEFTVSSGPSVTAVCLVDGEPITLPIGVFRFAFERGIAV